MLSGNIPVDLVNSHTAAIASAQASADAKVTKVDLLSDMKALTPITGQKVYVCGRITIGDGLGGLYYWDSSDTTSAEDATYLNIVVSTSTNSGRWVRSFQKMRKYGTANMELVGGAKHLYLPGTTDSSGNATVYLTDNNGPTGNALFTEVWFHNARVNVPSTDASTAIDMRFKSLSSDLKTLVYGSVQPNIKILALALYNPLAIAPTGVTVLFKVDGI